ncbi:hypothetical protein Hanom_Chr07g00636331 [Helianthus anomalus]
MVSALIKEGAQFEELTLDQAIQKLKGYAWTLEDQDSDFEKLQDHALYGAKQVEKEVIQVLLFILEETSQGDPTNQSAFVVGINNGSTTG